MAIRFRGRESLILGSMILRASGPCVIRVDISAFVHLYMKTQYKTRQQTSRSPVVLSTPDGGYDAGFLKFAPDTVARP